MAADTQGDRLRQARIYAGFATPADAARHHRWNPNTYKSHENGIRGLKPTAADKYAKAFRVGAGWLLTGEGAPPGVEEVPLDRERFRTVVERIIEADRTIGANLDQAALARFAERLYERLNGKPLDSSATFELLKEWVFAAEVTKEPRR